ncbi:MAG: ABC transporter permease [Lawsonibacter sp.]
MEKTNRCVLGAGPEAALFDYTDPVGETITLNGSPSWWWAGTEPMDMDYWPEMDNIIVLPYTFNRT